MKDNSTWLNILDILKNELTEAEINQWLSPLNIKTLNGNPVVLTAPNKFFKTWVEDNYLTLIKKTFRENLGLKTDIDIVISIENKDDQTVRTVSVERSNVTTTDATFDLPLNKRFTFDNFVVGTSNRYAHAACSSLISGKTTANPLYIYGDVGLGKTHLMHAVGNEFKERFPKYRILYTTGESFVNDFVTSMRLSKLDSFKQRYLNIDLFLCDDVQFIAGKSRTMEEFFFTFSQLYATQKQIVLTSNTSPNNIKELDPRLSSRFTSGLMVDVSTPSVEEKEAIIKKYIEIEDLTTQRFSDDIIRYLANNLKSDSTREILGATLRIFTLASIDNEDITIQFAEKHLKDFLMKRDKTLSPDSILELTAKYYQLKVSDLKSKNRSKTIALARSIAMYLIREKLSLSYTEISSIFSRDHSTALHAVNKITDELLSNHELEGTINVLLDKMKLIH